MTERPSRAHANEDVARRHRTVALLRRWRGSSGVAAQHGAATNIGNEGHAGMMRITDGKTVHSSSLTVSLRVFESSRRGFLDDLTTDDSATDDWRLDL
jgi:hypothetical protein